MSGVKVMLEPQIHPNPAQPLPAANLFTYARPLLLSRWVEDAFEVEVRPSLRSKPGKGRSKAPRPSSPKA
jgi:hypothetical protein